MIEILSETAHWWLIHKPEGLTVHNNEASGDLLSHLAQQLKLAKEKLHPVHRLDRETSGLMLFAKSPQDAHELQTSLGSESSHKLYHAILKGVLKKESNWVWPISDKAEGRQNPQGKSADRKPATTQVRILRQLKYFTYVECEIVTGRQHQIRKHAAIAGNAVVGDPRYAEPRYNKMIEERYQFSRMALHACRLQFVHRDQEFNFEAPIPPEFQVLLTYEPVRSGG